MPQTWVYVQPERLRHAIAHYEAEIASLRLTLEAVERGESVITGESPIDSSVSYFTSTQPKATPFE